MLRLGLANLLLRAEGTDSKARGLSYFPAAPTGAWKAWVGLRTQFSFTPQNSLWPYISRPGEAQHVYLLPAVEPVTTPKTFSDCVHALCCVICKGFCITGASEKIPGHSCFRVLGTQASFLALSCLARLLFSVGVYVWW